ncbi:exonuclease domain-containing protein [Olleya marilimosa]|uniref:Excinuclease cho n=1 Tax=Olleya marilimosa TaxID=272164 RepID=A0ABR8LRL4_9FLAO|nr:exonuclease domain-containing protein [Olleya marilimosa]MBD3862331.1 GIY-YIG nuclease family protein [Olleya marilimosa]MBD3889829.1 GIY-YIG nuclease family protein [Olleya marilimosa]
MIYTIIDVETSGKSNKITEISVFKYDGTKVIDEFTSLINPEVYIPDYITSLTGIDNATVADAPTFAEVANDILAITEGTTFVAHNVNFDYNVIRNEFKALGIDFNRKKLCTVRLSRKLLPGHKSYSLGKLCKSLDITIVDRHRARGDAEATVILFEMLLNQEAADKVFADFLKKSSKEATLPSHLPTSVFNKLPNSAGIYYFKNKKGEIIYIGKAKDIKKRVLSHFYSKAQKSLDLCRNTADIDFELSGSELIALLMEDAAIKQHYPEYNVVSKRTPKAYAIFNYEDRQGITHLAYNTLKATPNPIETFSNVTDCRQYLEQLCTKFALCPKFCHLQDGVVQCSHYKITTCKGVCANQESVTDYNLRVSSAIDYINNNKENVVLKQKGRHNQEEAFVLIKDNIYLGYGFIDKSEQINNPEDLETFLIPQKENFDVWKILRSVLK